MDNAPVANPESEGRQKQCKIPMAYTFPNSPVWKVHLKGAYAAFAFSKVHTKL